MKYIGYQDEEKAEKWARKYLGIKSAPSVLERYRLLMMMVNLRVLFC